MKFRAVLFDLDGTLLDTLQDLADAMNRVLLRAGFAGHPPEAYKIFVGDGMETLVRRTLPETHGSREDTVSACLASVKQEYRGCWMETTRPYPGIPELLDQLTARQMRMSILSNKPNDFTREMVRYYLSSWHFECVFGERPNVPRKPDPHAALEIVERSGIPPGAFAYLGDTATDMVTAAAAGMYAIGVLWGFRSAEELTANGARVLISKPADLLELLWG
jgi:phosphoglycolate phosphatase